MFAEIIVDITNEALDRAFTYHVPDGLGVKLGDRVEVPFGISGRTKTGYVIGLRESVSFPMEKIKDISGKVENAISVQGDLIRLAAFMSREYGTTMNQCLRTVLPVKRTVRKNSRRIDPLLSYRQDTDEKHALNDEQEAAVQAVSAAFQAGKSVPFLLFGITGSGKTEVYLHIMEEVVAAGKQVILLIPEISLTYQTVRRVYTRFQGKVAIMNSRMTAGERYEAFEKCRKGEVSVMVGPRSAVFAPFERLGLIIMDEEHERAYKSETAPRYETRDVAFIRAHLAKCPILYGSATPSLTMYQSALKGRIKLLRLSKRAKEGAALPETEIIDLRDELRKGNRSVFSDRLKQLMTEALSEKRQIMLFLNRRGYSNFLSCRSCGESVRCPHCDVSLTLHQDGMLRCHYCGYEEPVMKVCPHCGSKYLAPFGFGTEKLERYVKGLFPDARVLRMDADTTRDKGAYEKILRAFAGREADILIGTQMIVKGHDFPEVTVVGLVLADLSLQSPDFAASERTFQLITQAAGRAGRARIKGHVVIQTYQPEHYAITLSMKQDYISFYEKEMTYRRLLRYPPVEKLLTVQFQSMDEDTLSQVTEYVAEHLRGEAPDVSIIGPVQASVYRVKDVYRKIIYVKHDSHDIIIQLRERMSALSREIDPRGLVLLNFDIQ